MMKSNSDQITWKNELGSGGRERRGKLWHVIEPVAATGHARLAARRHSESILLAVVSLAHHGSSSATLPLTRLPRLSVMPVTDREWDVIERMARK